MKVASRTPQGSTPRADEPHVEFFESPLTPELWEAYERATHSYTCTRAFIEYFRDYPEKTLALVTPLAGDARAAFLYRVRPDGCTAVVLGRFWSLGAEALAAFAQAVFDRHPRVARIETNTVDALPDTRAMGRPVLVVREVVEMRIPVPATLEEYEARLGKRTHGHTRYHERRLVREHPSARFVTLERADIPRSWIADIVGLNRERMASKRTASVFSPRYEEGIFRVAQVHGCVTVLLVGSRVCAGTIDIVCGPEAYAWVIGHDDAFGKFSPGRLCQTAAIRHYMDGGVRTIHLLYGESRHKRELGGRRAPLASYVVLRSWARLRPQDVSRVCSKHLLRVARYASEEGDLVAQRVLGGRTPLTSLAHTMARRWRSAHRR